MRVEHGVREERARPREPLVEPVVKLLGESVRLRRCVVAGKDGEQRLHIVVGHSLVERDDDAPVTGPSQIDFVPRGRGDDVVRRRARELDANRVEKHITLERVSELLQPRREHRGTAMDPSRDGLQPLGAVPHGVHARDHREEHLRRAHVRRRLLAADVLLARLECHAQRRPSARIAAHADDAARQHAFELVLRGEERRVRPAVAQRDAEALRVADADVRAPLARRSQEGKTHEVRRHDDERICGMGPRAGLAVVEHGAAGRRILEQQAKDVRTECRSIGVTHRGRDPSCMGARLHHGDRLRVTALVDEEGVLRVATLGLVRQEHGFGRCRALVQQRGVRDLQTGEVHHHRLKIEERLEATLRDLRLIRRVRGVPAGILQNVSLDDRWRECIVVAVAEI